MCSLVLQFSYARPDEAEDFISVSLTNDDEYASNIKIADPYFSLFTMSREQLLCLLSSFDKQLISAALDCENPEDPDDPNSYHYTVVALDLQYDNMFISEDPLINTLIKFVKDYGDWLDEGVYQWRLIS